MIFSQIEQSQTDRSRKRFFPIKLAFRGDQVVAIIIVIAIVIIIRIS